jgi:hypothetical protein
LHGRTGLDRSSVVGGVLDESNVRKAFNRILGKADLTNLQKTAAKRDSPAT